MSLADDGRGQLVLLAGVAVALAVLALLAAFLQLGYHADVATSGVDDRPIRDGERTLDRAVHEAARDLRGDYRWADRSGLVTALRDRLDPRFRSLEGSGVDEGIIYRVAYNASAASRWIAGRCPGGPGREFGPCVATRGVVVQMRDGRATVLGVAVDLTVTTPGGESTATLVVEVGA